MYFELKMRSLILRLGNLNLDSYICPTMRSGVAGTVNSEKVDDFITTTIFEKSDIPRSPATAGWKTYKKVRLLTLHVPQ